jgi:oligopeptide/dipeptide ABC transporter ATP-binding protein
VLSLLRRLADEGLSVLLVSHDIGAIGSIADRIAVLYAGRIVESGPTVDVVSAPRHPYTRGLLASVPRLRGRVSMPPGREGDRGDPADPDPLAPIPGHPPALGATPTGCAFHPRCRVRLERCAGERPELASVDGRRLVACWRPHASGAPCP